MNHCLNCGREIIQQLSLKEILLWKKLVPTRICSFCFQQLVVLNNNPHCQNCYKLFDAEKCPDCVRWQEEFQIYNQHTALYSYNGFIHDYFRRYKRHGDVLLAGLFEAELKAWFSNHKFDVVTYIPSSQSHLSKRGFDPVYELYRNVVEIQKFFEKDDADRPQAQKNRHERMNTQQTFRLVDDFPKISTNSKILIVDDIYTTGRTILHARQLLRQSGFQNICTFSLSH